MDSEDHAPNSKLLLTDDAGLPGPKTTVKLGFLVKRKQLVNILLLGVGFMFSMGSYNTCAMASTVILSGIHDEYFSGTDTIGYTILCVVYGSTAVSFLMAPSVSAILGPKITMVTGAMFLLCYVTTFLRPLTETLYLGAVAQGIGQGLIWTVYGFMLSTNSSEKTIGRNTGIFWCLLQSSLVSGNLFYFFMLRGVDVLPEGSRIFIFVVLIVSAALGIVVLSLLRHPWTKPKKGNSHDLMAQSTIKSDHQGPLEAITAMMRLLFSRKMMLLLPTYIYVGLDLSFYINVYGTSLGYTGRFGELREALVGLNGVFLGVGQIVGGLLWAALGRFSQKRGRDPALITGMLTHLLAYYLIFLNIPGNATLGHTNDAPYIGSSPSPALAMLCSALLGFGDAAWINQLCALLGTLFKEDCVSAFALFQFIQCATTSFAFFYSAYLTMLPHVIINVVFACVGAAGYCFVEWEAASETIRKSRRPNGIPETKTLLRESRSELPIYTDLYPTKTPILVVHRQQDFDVNPAQLTEFL
ncbi:UNC93-like protein MFSD11 [Hypsibius exemplaris]|uniref:UNC93-like protein MFSD11 n=1 Tax=Hypsibius exemplaris TaxID=2072580 RepID=A0A1W0WYD6_HYPEX|nr:UNC93-like protein MFSD11 [Hypsibius exemplaris]